MSLPGEEAFVPKGDHDKLIEELREIKAQISAIIEERNQLREALSKVNAGIHKASEFGVQGDRGGELHLHIETWRKAREIAMDLMHIKNDNQSIVIEYHDGKLTKILGEHFNE